MKDTQNIKKCERCKKEIDIDAKQCPYCKQWVYSKKQQKTLKIIGITLLLSFLLLIIIIVISALNTTPIDYENLKEINISEPHLERQKNVKRALDLYDDEYFKFTGTVWKVYEDTVQISCNTNKEYSVHFYFSSEDDEIVKSLEIGDTITFAGKLSETVFGGWDVKNGVILEPKK